MLPLNLLSLALHVYGDMNSLHIEADIHYGLTQSDRCLLAKQFLTVFSRWGGSDMKNRSLPSVE